MSRNEHEGQPPHLRRSPTLACLLAFMGNFVQYQVSGYASQLMPILGIDKLGFSVLFLSPMFAAFVLGLPLGFLGDKLGYKRVISIAFIVSLVGGCTRILFVSSFGPHLLSMILLGVGMCALSSNVVKIMGTQLGEKADLAIGAYYAISCLGMAAAQASPLLFPDIRFGYTAAELTMAALVALWIFTVPDVPSTSPTSLSKSLSSDSPHTGDLEVVLRSRGVWACAITLALSSAASTAYAGILPQALELSRGFSAAESDLASSLLTLVGIMGCLATPALYARFNKSMGYLFAICLISFATMLAAWFVPEKPLVIMLLIAAGIATTMIGPVVEPMPMFLPEIGPERAGTAGGFTTEVSLAGTFLIPTAISALTRGDYTAEICAIALCYAATAIPLEIMRHIQKNPARHKDSLSG